MTAGTDVHGTTAMYRSLVGVGMICALVIVFVFQFTAPIIAKNRAEALEAAIFEVLPEAKSRRSLTLTDGQRLTPVTGDAGGLPIYAGYDEGERLVGFAIEAAGMGYQDTIRVLYGYSPNRQAIVGIQILESKETPGLGDRIEKDPEFLKNFVALDVSLTNDRTALANPIEVVKSGEKEQPWQIDGITGATISSVAIGEILGRSASQWLPKLDTSLADLQTDRASDADADE